MRDLRTIGDLDEVLSQDKPVLLFKHSTRCPVSTFADDNYRAFVEANDDGRILFTHLDLIEYRDVSNAITERTDIPHQSPQAILVVNGKAVWNASHTLITAEALKKAVEDNC